MSDKIEPGTTVFLDANILLYAVSGHWRYGRSSKDLLDAINSGEYEGIISVLVCNEVFHRSMIAEIVEKQNISPASVLKCMKENPGIVKKSAKAWAAMEKIKQIRHLKIVGVDEGILELAFGYSKMYGLLSNDALRLATMNQEGISTIASNDRDFEAIEWINLWRP